MLTFNLKGGSLTRIDSESTATEANAYPSLLFNKYDIWAELSVITARFMGADGDIYDQLLVNNQCTVPAEVMAQEYFFVSVKGANASIAVTTNQVRIDNAYSGFELNAQNASEITPDILSQIAGIIPSKTSQLTNDSDFVTSSDISSAISEAAEAARKYSAGDTFDAANLQVAGILTQSSQNLYLTVYLPKSVEDVNVTVSVLRGYIRGVDGYLDNTSNVAQDYLSSSYTTTVSKKTENIVQITVAKSTAFTNCTNNTPVSMHATEITLSFTEST